MVKRCYLKALAFVRIVCIIKACPCRSPEFERPCVVQTGYRSRSGAVAITICGRRAGRIGIRDVEQSSISLKGERAVTGGDQEAGLSATSCAFMKTRKSNGKPLDAGRSEGWTATSCKAGSIMGSRGTSSYRIRSACIHIISYEIEICCHAAYGRC